MGKKTSKAERVAEVKKQEEKWLSLEDLNLVRRGKKPKKKKPFGKSIPGQAVRFVQGGKVSPR